MLQPEASSPTRTALHALVQRLHALQLAPPCSWAFGRHAGGAHVGLHVNLGQRLAADHKQRCQNCTLACRRSHVGLHVDLGKRLAPDHGDGVQEEAVLLVAHVAQRAQEAGGREPRV
jgi:hypothetical protein